MKPDTILLSTIPSCYNYGRFLRGGVASTRLDTSGCYEKIIIDDDSSNPGNRSPFFPKT